MSFTTLLALTLLAAGMASGGLHQPPSAVPGDRPPAASAPEGDESATATIPLVAVQLPDTAMDTSLKDFAEGLPKTPPRVDPIQMQTVLASPPPDENPLVARIRATYGELYALRLENEPKWRYGLNPMVWVARTRGGAADWWEWYKRQPAADLPFVEVFPFVYDETKAAPDTPAPRARARQFNNQALDILFGKGDLPYAADLMGRAVTADPTYPISAYHAGVLQMVQHNREAAIRMFIESLRRGAKPPIQERCNEYLDRMRKLVILLLNDKGSQRRIYTDNVDAAWALVNVGQSHAAAVFAGQALSIDRDEERPEADLVVAMICARENRPKSEVIRWLQYALGRCATNAPRRIVSALLRDVISAPAAPAMPTEAPPPAPPPAPPMPAPTTDTGD